MSTYNVSLDDGDLYHVRRSLARQIKHHRRSVDRLLAQESTPPRITALDRHRLALLEVRALLSRLDELKTIDRPGERPRSAASAR